MKAIKDPRHKARRQTVRELFALTFDKKQECGPRTKAVVKHQEMLDKSISSHAPEWPIEKLNKTDLAILRLAVYELLVERKEPMKVIIDEAVELAKEFGSEHSPSFVNGVLGSIVKEEYNE